MTISLKTTPFFFLSQCRRRSAAVAAVRPTRRLHLLLPSQPPSPSTVLRSAPRLIAPLNFWPLCDNITPRDCPHLQSCLSFLKILHSGPPPCKLMLMHISLKSSLSPYELHVNMSKLSSTATRENVNLFDADHHNGCIYSSSA